jgi:hypothetical protein
MASCAACGSTLLFIKKRVGGLQFCNDKCVARGQVALRAQHIPESQALERAIQLQHAPCPACGGRRPVDVFTTHTVWSALIVTVWKSTPRVSCKRCAVTSQAYATIAAALVGWWGFPWGLIVTPIQILRNIAGMFQSAESGSPSKQLKHIARMDLASRALASPARGAA